MAASILLICWGLVDHRGIRALFRVSRAEFVVMSLTCVATLLLELQTAIYAGVLASLFFYLKRTSQPRVQHWRDGEADVLRVGGSIFFGASHYLQVRLQRLQGERVVIEAQHGCMTGRGVKTPGVGMVTSRLMGCFLDDSRSRKEVLSLMGY